ncbi:hypothetical protein GAYE_PCTG10G0429 [Galdieria yellowstonensis]|uniref:TIP41-like protein n=1 Tax=Galdieria yellowstonensis TaxID=3028027 RepID=A0AAV9I627_9RHOD|nr:hypothetical protein GAYE_PCTG10G0429 [Galdieria yellowstonensis]
MSWPKHEVQTPPYYLHSEGKGIDIDKWSIIVTEGPILSSNEIESWQSQLALKLPTMAFGQNTLSFHYNRERKFYFSTFDALQTVSHCSSWLRVKPAALWENRQANVDLFDANYDWTFSTTYGGTWLMQGEETPLSATESCLDWSLLRREDIPLLFFKELTLYEDELDDQGISSLSVRLRVMSSFFYVLCRFWLRVDDVHFRLYDTRIYHQWNSNVVMKEYSEQEASFQQVSEMGVDSRWFTNSDFMQKVLPLTKKTATRYYLTP